MRLFRDDDYNVEKLNDVKDLSRLEEGQYDIVLFDLDGVGTRQSPRSRIRDTVAADHRNRPNPDGRRDLGI
jgi:hypothetical protein